MGIFDNGITKEEKEQIFRHLDQLEARISTLKSGDKAAIAKEFQGLASSIESYISPEEKDVLKIRDQILECLTGAAEAQKIVQNSRGVIEKEAQEISDFRNKTQALSTEAESTSLAITKIFDQATSHLGEVEQIKTSLKNITAEVDRLGNLAETSKKKIETFETSSNEVEEAKNKIVQTQKNTRDLLNDVKSLHIEIFGKDEVNEETGKSESTPGLVSKLKNSYSDIEAGLGNLKTAFEDLKKGSESEYASIKTSWNAEFELLKTRIESLLPGALSAGLSQAYEEKKNFEIAQMNKSNIVFYIAIAVLTVFACAAVLVYLWLLIKEKKTFEEIAKLSPIVSSILIPMYLPTLWLAYSTAKKANLSKRLAEEYAHKAALSKTFEGISRQVSNISSSDLSADLASKLLYNLIQVSSENPGKLISDYTKADHPLHEVLDKSMEFSESLEKLSFIPGIDKIISLITKKNQRTVTKVSEALEAAE